MLFVGIGRRAGNEQGVAGPAAAVNRVGERRLALAAPFRAG